MLLENAVKQSAPRASAPLAPSAARPLRSLRASAPFPRSAHCSASLLSRFSPSLHSRTPLSLLPSRFLRIALLLPWARFAVFTCVTFVLLSYFSVFICNLYICNIVTLQMCQRYICILFVPGIRLVRECALQRLSNTVAGFPILNVTT